MTEAFSKLEPSKQKQILRAALKEFAQHGYAQASTNTIVKEAGISKGMLFYYFTSKQDLFNYLVEYVLDHVEKGYLVHLDHHEPDFLARYSRSARIKMESYIKDGEIFEFLGALYLRQGDEPVEELLRARLDAMYQAAMEKMLDNVDSSLFRDDIPPEYVMKLTAWAMEGYQKELTDKLRGANLSDLDMRKHWDDFYDFLAVLRTILYRQKEV